MSIQTLSKSPESAKSPNTAAPNTAAPTTLSITQLTDRIDTHTHTYLSPSFLQSLRPNNPAIKPQTRLELPAYLSKIATSYGNACALIWQLALAPRQPNLHNFAQANKPQPLTDTLQDLCTRWAIGKYSYPQASFFQNITTLGSLRAKWHYPAIQNSLQQTTHHLRQSAEYGPWLDTYPTCWAYTVGRTMHQLLQWNHRLTSKALREFLSITEENTEATAL